jgi:leucine dehydrogenase
VSLPLEARPAKAKEYSMSIFSAPDFDNHELVTFCCDDESGLKAIIAIHNTNRGPALGGCRYWNYKNEQEAITDVLRLSRGMTYKSALANLPLGGGKSVIIGDARQDKTPEKMRAFGRFIEKLKGIYITAEDVNTTPEDMAIINQETKHVVGLVGQGGSGDPSVITAYGVYIGLKSCVNYKFNAADLSGIHVAIQGLGHVGMELARLLHQEGVKLTVADINNTSVQYAVDHFGATAVSPESILSTSCDILAPCALGGVINDQSIDQLKCQIIAGAANNQLAEARHGAVLHQRHILYAPDYLINAGGLINVTHEGPHYDRAQVMKYVEGIGQTMTEILKMAEEKNIPTNIASDQVAEQRFQKQ